ncbi:hypothetical protein BDV12DRAFT_169791 [Aspergillus spectabilis]
MQVYITSPPISPHNPSYNPSLRGKMSQVKANRGDFIFASYSSIIEEQGGQIIVIGEACALNHDCG